jgi:hypothetical protein
MKKLLLLCLVLLVTALQGSADEQTIYGYISCSVCAAKGATDTHRECMEKCIAKGANVVLVTDYTNEIVRIDNPDLVSSHYAHRVALSGYFKDSAFHILSVRILY